MESLWFVGCKGAGKWGTISNSSTLVWGHLGSWESSRHLLLCHFGLGGQPGGLGSGRRFSAQCQEHHPLMQHAGSSAEAWEGPHPHPATANPTFGVHAAGTPTPLGAQTTSSSLRRGSQKRRFCHRVRMAFRPGALPTFGMEEALAPLLGLSCTPTCCHRPPPRVGGGHTCLSLHSLSRPKALLLPLGTWRGCPGTAY